MWLSLLACRPFICISSDLLRFGHLWRHIHLRTQHWMVMAAFSLRLSRTFSSSCLTTSLSQTKKYTLGDHPLQCFNKKEKKKIPIRHSEVSSLCRFQTVKGKTSSALKEKKKEANFRCLGGSKEIMEFLTSLSIPAAETREIQCFGYGTIIRETMIS